MSDSLFLILVLVVFGVFIAVLAWAQMTTPTSADFDAGTGRGSNPPHG